MPNALINRFILLQKVFHYLNLTISLLADNRSIKPFNNYALINFIVLEKKFALEKKRT